MEKKKAQKEEIKFGNWNDNIGCGPYTYWAELSNGDPLPDFIDFDANKREFEIKTADG